METSSWRRLNSSSTLPPNAIFLYLDYKFPSKIKDFLFLVVVSNPLAVGKSVKHLFTTSGWSLLCTFQHSHLSFLPWGGFVPISPVYWWCQLLTSLAVWAQLYPYYCKSSGQAGLEFSSGEKNGSLCNITAAMTKTAGVTEVQNQHRFNKKNWRLLISLKWYHYLCSTFIKIYTSCEHLAKNC